VLAVYTGPDIPSLLEIASNDDLDETIPIRQSRVTFRATGGVAYQVAVDGAGGAQGDFKLNWAPHAVLQVSLQGANFGATLTVAEAGLYTIEQSTNLVNWTLVQQVTAGPSPVTLDLGPVAGVPRRFYRASQ